MTNETTPPEFAATPETLGLYRMRPSFSVFFLACLLHRADPEKVFNIVFSEWNAHQRVTGNINPDRVANMAMFHGNLNFLPETLLGGLLGGTIKRIKLATGHASIEAQVTRETAVELAGILGLTLPPEMTNAPQAIPTKPKRRRDLLAPLIEAAQRECVSSDDAPAIFVVLREWATTKPPRPPLVGMDGSIRWMDGNSDQPQELSLKNLRDRLRQRRKAA